MIDRIRRPGGFELRRALGLLSFESMGPRDRSAKSPDHYGSPRRLLIGMVSAYLRGVDATIRLLGGCVIMGALFGALWAGLNAISSLLIGDGLSGKIVPAAMLLVAPPIIRVGMLGAGFRIPAVFQRRDRSASGD